jgi:hypothetical protein
VLFEVLITAEVEVAINNLDERRDLGLLAAPDMDRNS